MDKEIEPESQEASKEGFVDLMWSKEKKYNERDDIEQDKKTIC